MQRIETALELALLAGRAALTRLYHEVTLNEHADAGIGMRELERMGVLNKEKTSVKDNYASNVEQFLNRIMVLPVEKQNQFFELFYLGYVEAVESGSRIADPFGI